VLRAACYVIVAVLSGMRDSELQDLRRGCLHRRDQLTVMESIQHKGNDSLTGITRTWWTPDPAAAAIGVLEQICGYDLLFARPYRPFLTCSSDNPGPYAPERDIPRLLEFLNAAPDARVGRGAALGFAAVVGPAGHAVNATSLRRSFAVYAARRPGAELGLGIQLGHAALRMTSGYISDGQQTATKMLDDDRAAVVTAEVHRLITGHDQLAGDGGQDVLQVRARVLADPRRAEDLQAHVADSYHLGLLNDCHYRPGTAACGDDGPHLASSFCATSECGNAVVHAAHAPALRAQLARHDAMLARPKLHPSLERFIRDQRARTVGLLAVLDTRPEPT
jgi:hypothetical protein